MMVAVKCAHCVPVQSERKMICQLEDSFNSNMMVTFVLCSSYSLVNVVLWCLYLRHILRVPDEPQDLITGK